MNCPQTLWFLNPYMLHRGSGLCAIPCNIYKNSKLAKFSVSVEISRDNMLD